MRNQTNRTVGLLVLLFLGLPFSVTGRTQRELDAIASLEVWKKQMVDANAKPPAEQIALYGGIVLRLGGPWSFYPVDEKWPVYQEAQKKLLSIPGHAEYFANKLFDAYGKSKDPFLDEGCHDLLSLTCDTLAQMPSEETVRMAGRMLEYTGDVPSPQRLAELKEKLRTPGSVSATRMAPYAAGLFARLPIEHSPQRFRGLDGPTGDEAVWKQWWQEVKDGKRRYRFEGTEEWLPKDSPAPPPGMKRPPKDDRLPGGHNDAGSALPGPAGGVADGTQPESAPVWPWVAGIAALTGAAVWWTKRRKGSGGPI
jgi:hypothetical protein